MDALDIKILNILQPKGRTKRNVIAEQIGLSIPSVSERLHKLEEKGIITGYYTKLNHKAFGYDIMAFIQIFMESSKFYDEFIKNVTKVPQIIECHSILGEGSHICKVMVKNTEALEKLLGDIQSWPGITATKTTFVLSTIKETTTIDI